MEENIYMINVGALSSYTNLYKGLAPSLSKLRELYDKRKLPNAVCFDFRFIERKKIKVSALTYLLSVAYNIEKLYNKPSIIIMNWDPYILSFLHDLNFIHIANRLNLFDWDKYIGGYQSGTFNPNSKIQFYGEPQPLMEFNNKIQLDSWKEMKRNELENELYREFVKILLIKDLDSDYNDFLIDKLTSTCAELIVNTLLHGNEICFIGYQRTSKGVSISVSDSGLGLSLGLKNYRKWSVKNESIEKKYLDTDNLKDVDALVNASLIKRYDVGLKSAIDDIINDLNGYVTMSSGTSEIRWEKHNWNIGMQKYNYDESDKILQTAEKILGKESEGFLEPSEYYKGYYKNHNYYLKGTRISFEVPFETNLLRK